MKTHRLILFFCFSLVFFTGQVFAADFPGSKTVVAYVQPNQGNPYYAYGTFGIDIGYKYVSEAGESETARTKFTFDLTTIPPNAEITSVQLSYYAYNYANSSYKFKMTQIGNYNSPQEIWQNIGQASSLFTDVAYASGSLNSGTLTSMVNSSKGSYLYIGALSQNENNSDSRANLDLTLTIQFSVPPATVKITADNNFTASGGTNHGTMVIDGVNRTIPLTGYTFQKTVGQTLTLSANSPQNDNQGHQRIWHTGVTNPSNWTRDGVIKSPSQTYSFTFAADDNGKIYMANLRKNFKIDQTHKTEFDGNQTQQNTAWIVELNSGNISTQLSRLINGRNYLFAGWEDDLMLGTSRNITPTDNKVYDVLYKYLHHSNQISAYSNPSQRRFIQTPDGVKHICYESMNRVWLEHSTDNGATWFLGNGGKPLSSVESKNPSMSFYGNLLGIVWQEKNSGTFKIKMAVFYMSDYSSSLFSTIAEDDNNYSHNASPVVEWGYNGNVVVVWSGNDLCANPFGGTALKYWYGSATSYGITSIGQCGIYGTDENSINPTITADYTASSNPFYFHFAWQQYVNVSTSKIYYSKLYYNQNSLVSTTFEEVSLNSGYSNNLTLVIVLRKTGSLEYIYVTWLGNRTSPTSETRVLLKYKLGSSWSVTGVYGTSPVQNFSINKGTTLISNQEPLALCWSEPNGSSFYNKVMKSPGSGIKTLITTGKDIRINNGTDFSSMFVNSFSSVSQPYSFSFSQNLGSLGKVNSMFNGREGIVGKNGAQFFFALGDITVDDQNINFVSIPDSVSIASLSLLNTYFESEPFNVSSLSNLTYGVQYGITDSVLCSSVLNSGKYISFKVELLDAVTNNVLDVFDEVNYTGNNVYQYNNLGYKVNLSGIEEKSVKLRLVTDTNSEFGFGFSNRIADQSMLAKAGFKTINYKGDAVVTEYALEQNYPNPFNPGTTIRYQLPKDGLVTLKIYDIIGSEIATLVNEEKIAGKYEVNFDASNLASGIYVYRIAIYSEKLQAGEYFNSKKMILLK